MPQYTERPVREFPPMTAAKTAIIEDLAVKNKWRQEEDGSWQKRW